MWRHNGGFLFCTERRHSQEEAVNNKRHQRQRTIKIFRKLILSLRPSIIYGVQLSYAFCGKLCSGERVFPAPSTAANSWGIELENHNLSSPTLIRAFVQFRLTKAIAVIRSPCRRFCRRFTRLAELSAWLMPLEVDGRPSIGLGEGIFRWSHRELKQQNNNNCPAK